MTKAQAHPAEFKGTDLKSEKDFFFTNFIHFVLRSEIADDTSLVFKKILVSDWRNKTFKLILDSKYGLL